MPVTGAAEVFEAAVEIMPCLLYFHILKASTCKVVDSLLVMYKLIVGVAHMMSISAVVGGDSHLFSVVFTSDFFTIIWYSICPKICCH